MSRFGIGLALAILLSSAAYAEPEVVSVSRAGEHVGQQTTIEGRIVATHASPLATVLAFTPNFAGFTATILAADRSKFPDDFEQRYRDKLVRVTGTVTAYRGKPEMAIREPSQVQVILAPGQTPLPPGVLPAEPTPAATATAPQALETTRALAAIEERLAAIEARLAGVEQALGALARPNASTAPSRAPTLGFGVPAVDVRQMFGDPPFGVTYNPDGGSTWQYGGGRTISFDRNGRVVAWTGY